jgi:aminoglycoside phosphotransferase (APT) family kinase protein
VTDPTSLVDRLAGGASNLTLLLELDDRQLVLRRRPLGHTPPKAHDMAREFTVLQALYGHGVPVPRVIAFHGADDLVGAPCYLMDYRPGLVVHGPAEAADITPEQATAISVALIDTLGDLHQVDPAAVGLADFGRPEGFVARRIASWLKQWRAVPHRDVPEIEQLGAELLSRVPEQAGSTVVHGDYRLGNVILAMEPTVQVQAVVDWELSTLGDPLTDLAHLIAYWESSGPISHQAQLIARRPGFLTGSQLAALYTERTGRDTSALPFYLAFENWRAAIIKEGIYQRRTGQQAEPDADLLFLGEAVGLHLQEAAAILTDLAGPSGTVPPAPPREREDQS